MECSETCISSKVISPSSATTLEGQHKLLQRQKASRQNAPALWGTLPLLVQLCPWGWIHIPSREKQGQKEKKLKWTPTFQKSQPCRYESSFQCKNSALKSHSPEQLNNPEVIFSLEFLKILLKNNALHGSALNSTSTALFNVAVP